ncbi:unnamed protein product, partial [Linum tenue]
PPSLYTIRLFSITLLSNYLTYYLLTLIHIPIFSVLSLSFNSSRWAKSEATMVGILHWHQGRPAANIIDFQQQQTCILSTLPSRGPAAAEPTRKAT